MSTQVPEHWALRPIGEVCTSVELITPSEKIFSYFKYVDISSIDRDQKEITSSEEIFYPDAPSRARQVINANDVLVSTVRPALNAVALVPENLDGQICSTGLCVLRAKQTLLHPEFLFACVRSSAFVQNIVRLERGIGYPAVSDSDVRSLLIPLPPFPEQRRIVAILREADRLRRLRRAADAKAQQLLPALFYEMFGDPATNPKEWNVTKLQNVCNRITDGTHQPPPFIDEGIPFLFVSNIINGEIDLNTAKHISHKTYETLMKRCPIEKGDILYSTVGSYGVAVVVETDMPFAFQRHIAHIKPDRTVIDSFFLCTMLNSAYVKAQADQRSRGIAQETLNLGEIEEFIIYVPPISLQREFAEKVGLRQEIKRSQVTISQTLDTLFQSLLAQAFSGELTAKWREEREGLESIQEYHMSSKDEFYATDALVAEGHISFTDTVEATESIEIKMIPARNASIPLSKEQKSLFEIISKLPGYCTVETLRASSELPLYAIRQGLQLLTQVGLIQAVRLPDRPMRDIVYIPAYRNLTDDDRIQETDLYQLEKELERGIIQ